MTKISEIEKMIEAADVLGAPLFALDYLLDGLQAVELTGKKDLPEHEAAASIMWAAAEAAFAFACSPYLPDEIAAYRDDPGASHKINLGTIEAQKWIAPKKECT